ncbi:hypothetical protein [Ornithinibacillus halotolerans]|uniref:Uncharacterized protein n=1 Tax=Ornithinibacillus halotolerans TaxID=1274357 RepID=A0A916RJX1_9BACI|nr:hypothetical protein [Ornithinibacillus halotolerans]GGA60170.1 hypothetical protein GCM10008025_00230 [Ornithinibacillus halotolerans]
MRKLVVIVIIVLLFVGYLLGKKEDYTEDYPKIYKGFLDEHIGDWEVIDEREVEIIYKPFYSTERTFNRNKRKYLHSEDKPFFVPTYTYIKWGIEYVDDDGDHYDFVLSNMLPIEENLIDAVFEKLTEEMEEIKSEGMGIVIQDPYIRFGDLTGEDQQDQFAEIKNLYGDTLNLSKVGIDNAFAETPIYAIINFNYDEMNSMTENEFHQYVEQEMDALLELIPSLNASVIVDMGNENYQSTYLLQGKSVETVDKYVSSYDYNKFIKEKFPEFGVLKGTKND